MFIIAITAIVVMAIVLALSILYPNGAFQNHGLTYLKITASGTDYAYPQSATVYVSMNGTGATAAIATSNLTLTLNQFNYTVAKYIGNNSSRITTQSYSLQKIYNSSNYKATELVSVSIPQVQNVTPLLTTLSLIQNVYIGQVLAQLANSQISTLTQSALAQALQNATGQAAVLSGNRTLTIRNMTVSRNYVYPYPLYSNAGVSASGSNPIFFNGRQGVQEQITVVYSYG